jgi:hypothetical protein
MANSGKGAIDEDRLLACVDKMLDEQPQNRAAILRRLKEQNPALYTAWLLRTAAVPSGRVA